MIDSQKEMTESETEQTQQEKYVAEMEGLYGPIVKSFGFDFRDGRKIILIEFERVYCLRCFNPNIQDESIRGVQVNLTREAMFAFQMLYTAPRMPGELDLDEQLFNASLTPEMLEVWADVTKPMREYWAQVEAHMNELATSKTGGNTDGPVTNESKRD